jgi:hypothetical protein
LVRQKGEGLRGGVPRLVTTLTVAWHLLKEGMRQTAALVVSSFASVLCLAACGEGAAEESSDWPEIAALTEPLCENKGGTNAVQTAIAVAAAKELRRWSPSTDFTWNATSKRLELTATGRARCADKVCANTQAILDMQNPAANGKVTFPGGIKLDTTLLQTTLKTAWSAQSSCESSGTCKAAAHDFTYSHVENGSCDKKFFFDGYRAGTRTHLTDAESTALSNKLKFVGYPGNKMLNFYLREGQVSVDPTYGLNEGTSTKVASCDATCTKVTTTNVSGACCACNGATAKFSRAAWNANTYLCK